MECRYCFENGPLIFPCSCTTGIHQKCLFEWLLRPQSKKHCEICLTSWDNKHLTLKERCGSYYTALKMFVFVVSLYLCLLGSFIMCNISMNMNILQTYGILEIIFHILVCATCYVFPKDLWLRLWGILRIAFTAWPTIYLLNEWLDLMEYESTAKWLHPIFKQWEMLGAIQCVYLILTGVIFLKCQERRREDWESMPIGVI